MSIYLDIYSQLHHHPQPGKSNRSTVSTQFPAGNRGVCIYISTCDIRSVEIASGRAQTGEKGTEGGTAVGACVRTRSPVLVMLCTGSWSAALAKRSMGVRTAEEMAGDINSAVCCSYRQIGNWAWGIFVCFVCLFSGEWGCLSGSLASSGGDDGAMSTAII